MSYIVHQLQKRAAPTGCQCREGSSKVSFVCGLTKVDRTDVLYMIYVIYIYVYMYTMMYCRDLLRSWVYLYIGCRLRVNIG